MFIAWELLQDVPVEVYGCYRHLAPDGARLLLHARTLKTRTSKLWNYFLANASRATSLSSK